MIWAPIAACLSSVSALATFFTMLHLRLRWDVQASSVRWLFWIFFLFIFVRCATRSIFFIWMSMLPANQLVDESVFHSWTYGQLDRLGVHSIRYLQQARKAWITFVLCFGDLALCGIALTLFPLAYELHHLARFSMDRGVKKEQAQIRRYYIVIGGGVFAYGITQFALTIVHQGYNVYTHRCLLGVYFAQIVGLCYMMSQLLRLKINGRKYETVQGVFVASPVYQRLKHIMLVYAMFAVHFQASMLLIYFHDVSPDDKVMGAVGISLVVHNVFGLALAITTSCSQACVYSACRSCLPDNFEVEYLRHRLDMPGDADLEAPSENPVFVYTDIESSSALWAINGDVMRVATELHDDIMRKTLSKHRGYEITTVGDAFQVAFHTIRDAIEYCLDVQLQLLVEKWPKELHGMTPSVEKIRRGRRLVFNGLRVRMGIHDASDSDGILVQDVHTVTGKTTYTGVSEVIAEYVGDLGHGGQILMTERVAQWLLHHQNDVSVDVFAERVGEYVVPQVNAVIEAYQILPIILAGRVQHFLTAPRQRCHNNIACARSPTSGREQGYQSATEPMESPLELPVTPSTGFKPSTTPMPPGDRALAA